MTASSPSVTPSMPPHERLAGFLARAHTKAATKHDQPRVAGFRTKARGAEQVRNRDTTGAPSASAAAQAFDHAAFLKLLAQIYGVEEIEKARAEKLSGFTLDPAKGAQTGADGKLFAKVGDVSVEITKESVLTDSPVTPALAYQMAAAAAANPQSGKLVLEGTPDEKIMLFFAAQQLGLEIEESSIPEIPAHIAALAQEFHDYEREMNLPHIAGTYIPAAETAPTPLPTPAPAPTAAAEPVRQSPRATQTTAVPMGALSPA